MNIKINQKILEKILKLCKICCKEDNKYLKSANFIKTTFPGEIVSIDLMEINKNTRIIVAIDYFSRYIFAKVTKTKTSDKVLDFIKYVYEKFEFKKLNVDNGKEFNNSKLKRWCKDRHILLRFSIPYYHQSNGRVERANRTIRKGLKKEKGNMKDRLKKVVDVYNDEVIHRAIKMTPKEALKIDNRDLVIKNMEIYGREFKTKKAEKFNLNQSVIIRNETKRNKMDHEYDKVGYIRSILSQNVYEIKLKDGKLLRRHATQLKPWPGNVGYKTYISSSS
ncbi:Pro-Pol polyprotein [Dictyocoela muelleri]|nr:Pro-Pol polyprotein [Dictyocoela muelleri]